MVEIIRAWQGQVLPYLPMLKHLVFPSLALGVAIVATILVIARHATKPRTVEKWTESDDEVDEFLDWKKFDAKERAEAEARAECEHCKAPYLARDGHECAKRRPKVVPIPPAGAIVARPKKQAIYDREFVPRHAVVQKRPEPAPQSDVLSSTFYSAPTYARCALVVCFPSSNDFCVKGITLWPAGVKPEEWPSLVKNVVEIYDPSSDRVRNIPGQLVWRESGVGFTFDQPLLMPRASSLKITFCHEVKDRSFDVTAAVHGEHVPIRSPEESRAPLHWSIPFFQNFHSFIDGPPGAFKQWGTDCNLSGNGGALPQAHRFYGYKVSLTADTDMPDEDYAKIYDRGVVRLVLAQTVHASWPCRTIMPPPGQRHLEVARDMTVGDKPFALESLECFKFELSCSEPMSKQSGLMFHWWGILLTPVCG